MPRVYRRPGCGNGVICTGKITCHICNSNILGSWLYVFIIGFIGTIVTAYDIIRVINCKGDKNEEEKNSSDETATALDEDVDKNKNHTPIPVVPESVERDLKLMASVLGVEHYSLLMLGVLTDYPMLLVPWLLMQLAIIIIELVVFFIRLFLDGLHVNRDELLLALLTIYNWLQVFCLYQYQINHICL